MKTKIFALLLCFISVLTLIFSQVTASADTNAAIDIDLIKSCTEELNQTLADNNTTADKQLENLSENLSKTINRTADPSQLSRLSNMKSVTDMIFQSSYITTYGLSNLLPPLTTDLLGKAEQVLVLGLLGAAVAVLNVMHHDLTIELLVRSFYQATNSGEVYIPYYGYKVKHSQLFKDIANGVSLIGDEKLPNAILGTDGDLYLSIHKFKYTKPSANSKTVILTDTYDYNDSKEVLEEFPKIFHPIIKGMCALNRKGIVTYYPIKITEALAYSNLSIDVAYGYEERFTDVGANELKDFEVKPLNSGRRFIQTFSPYNTMLYILNSDGATLAYAEGNGYNGNALITFDFEKDKNYIIRVKLTDKASTGTVKLSVFHYSGEVNSFKELNLPELSLGTYTAEAAAKSVCLAVFIPSVTNMYKISFADNVKFNANLISIDDENLFATAYNYSGMSNGVDNENSYYGINKVIRDPSLGSIIDQGGGSSDSKVIEKTLKAGQKYIIKVCGYPVTSSGVKISFTISN